MKKTVLIVEDENNLNVLYDMFIREWGYDTIRTYSGEDALEAYKTNKPDAIVTDNKMRGMSGRELVDIIRQTDLETPILYHSGSELPTVVGIPNLYIGQKGVDVGYIQAFLKMSLENPDARKAMSWVPK